MPRGSQSGLHSPQYADFLLLALSILQAIRSALAEAQRTASGSGSAEQKAEAEIEVEVLTALQTAVQQK